MLFPMVLLPRPKSSYLRSQWPIYRAEKLHILRYPSNTVYFAIQKIVLKVGLGVKFFFLKISPIKILLSKFQKQLSKPLKILSLAFFSRFCLYGQILDFHHFPHIAFFGVEYRKNCKSCAYQIFKIAKWDLFLGANKVLGQEKNIWYYF